MKKIILIILTSFCIISCDDDSNLGIEKIMIIASKKIDCIDFVPHKCFLVKKENQQNWEYFYESISSFNYQEGFEYQILVLEEEIDNPPQDTTSLKYTFIKTISKIEKVSENIPD